LKAVIPAAGLGTRFLPVTKAQPKEMLPVAGKPAIQYVIEEVANSGIDDILIVTGRNKRSIEDHFDRSYELEDALREKGDTAALDEIIRIADMADIHYIRQKSSNGLGDAVHCAKKHVDNEPFVVLLGDTITLSKKPCTLRMIELYQTYKSSIIAVEKVPMEKVERYGIIAGEKIGDSLYKINDMIEKPKMSESPSDLAIFGRYLLTPTIFECIEKTKPGRGGEIQLTDAMRLLLEQEDIYAFEVTESRYDIGNKLDWIKASIDISLKDKEIEVQLRQFIKEIKA
jgi:UTP--glucose-1-phosphate uridylyltransferase